MSDSFNSVLPGDNGDGAGLWCYAVAVGSGLNTAERESNLTCQ